MLSYFQPNALSQVHLLFAKSRIKKSMHMHDMVNETDIYMSRKNNHYKLRPIISQLNPHTQKRGTETVPLFEEHYLTVHNMVPLWVLFWCPASLRCIVFRINMIIKEKMSAPLKKGTIRSNSTPGIQFWYPFFLSALLFISLSLYSITQLDLWHY